MAKYDFYKKGKKIEDEQKRKNNDKPKEKPKNIKKMVKKPIQHIKKTTSGSKTTKKKKYTPRGINKIILNDTTFTYNVAKDLAKKLNVSENEAKNIIKHQTKIAVNLKSGHVIQLDMKKKLNEQLSQFGTDIKRVSKKIYKDVAELDGKEIIARDSLSGFQGGEIKVKLGGLAWFSFYEVNPIIMEEIQDQIKKMYEGDEDAIAYLTDEEFLSAHNIVKRDWSEYARITEQAKYNGFVNGIEPAALAVVRNYRDTMPGATYIGHCTSVFSRLTLKQLKWDGVKLRNTMNYYSLDGFVNIRNVSGDNGNCVKNFLLKKFPNLERHISKLGDDKGVTARELINFCKSHKKSYYLYDINSVLLEKDSDELQSYISLILHNDHIYELTSRKPILKAASTQYACVENATKTVLNFMDKKIIPSNLIIDVMNIDKLPKECILACDYKGTSYIQNDEYDRVIKILEKFDIIDSIKTVNPNVKIRHLPKLLENKFIHDSVDSFFPGFNQFVKDKYTYLNQKMRYNENEFVAIDTNFSYLWALHSAEYLLICDMRTCKVEMNPTGTEKNKLYIVKPEKTGGILIPDKNIYCGEIVQKAENNGVKLTKLESFECKTMANIFRPLIDCLLEMYEKGHITRDELKDCYVRWIGQFESKPNITHSIENVKICLKEHDTTDGYQVDIGNPDYVLKYQKKRNNPHVFTRKPIAIQIKDISRMILFDETAELFGENDPTDYVKQMQCDSIVFKGKLPKGLDPNKFGAWKEDTNFSHIKTLPSWSNDKNISFYTSQVSERREMCAKKGKISLIYRALYDCYAGVGKTHFAINQIVKKLDKAELDYHIFTPSHESKIEYMKNGYPCTVIQDFDFGKHIPQYDVAIFDECGAISDKGWEFIYRCNLLEMNYICLGDFKQLLPFGSNVQFDNPPFMHYMFNRFEILDQNMRNDFEISFYDDIICGCINHIEVVKKYSTKKYYEADTIVCYRKKIAEKYNKQMLKKLKLEPYTSKVKYMCATNKYEEFYNHERVTVVEKMKDGITVKVNNTHIPTTIIIPKKEFDKNFKLAYAINIHQLQGSTVASYYYAPEDYRYISNGRVAYVIVSRIKDDKDHPDPGYQFIFNEKDFLLHKEEEREGILNSKDILDLKDVLEFNEMLIYKENEDILNLKEMVGRDGDLFLKEILDIKISHTIKSKKIIYMDDYDVSIDDNEVDSVVINSPEEEEVYKKREEILKEVRNQMDNDIPQKKIIKPSHKKKTFKGLPRPLTDKEKEKSGSKLEKKIKINS
jgi:hypothetical protein